MYIAEANWESSEVMTVQVNDGIEVTEGERTESKGEKTITPQNIMELGFAFWGSKALMSAVELGVFTVLADEPLDAANLQQKVGLHDRSARDFFDALVALGMLEREAGVYRNAPDTDRFLDRGKPSYIGGILEMANERLYPFWADLTQGLRTGEPQNELKEGGEDFFDVLYEDPDRLGKFLRAMTGVSMGANKAIARTFPFEEYDSFMDIGTAEGGLPVQVALAHDHVTGGGFDLPPVEPHFERYVDKHGLDERLHFHGGDFFEDPLPEADVLAMGHILHDWGLEEKKLLLKRSYEALPKGGAVIVYESIIDNGRKENAFGLLMSLNMLIETPKGFDYTARQCRGWMGDVGFRKTHAESLPGADGMVVGIK